MQPLSFKTAIISSTWQELLCGLNEVTDVKCLAECLTQQDSNSGSYYYCRRRCWSRTQSHSGGGGRSPSFSSGPPTCPAPGTLPELIPALHRSPMSPFPSLQRNHSLPGLAEGAFPVETCAPRWAPSPEHLHSAPPAEVTRSGYHFFALGATVRLPRHGAGRLILPRHRPTRQPLPTLYDPASGPLSVKDWPARLTAPAQLAARHHGTRSPANEGNSRQ